MARGRMLSKSLSGSECFANLFFDYPKMAEFCASLYMLMNSHTDDYGQISSTPKSLKLNILPAANRTIDEFKNALNILVNVGLVQLHADGKVARIIQFDKHQSLRKDRPKTNEFPQYNADNGLPWYDNGLPMTPTDIPMTPLREVKLSEVKIREEKEPSAPDEEKPHPPLKKNIYLNDNFIFENITQQQIKKWEEAYPAVSIPVEIKKAASWIEANPKNKKTNYHRFLVNWISRAQDKAGKANNGNPGSNKQPLSKAQQRTQNNLNAYKEVLGDDA